MEKEVSAFSMHQAFAYLCRELEEENKTALKQFVDISLTEGSDLSESTVIKFLTGIGIAAGECLVAPGANPNQIQTSVVDTKYPSGDKKWKGVYLAVYDNPHGDQVVLGSKQDTKKKCVNVAREASGEENRDVFILMGKETVDFSRCSAQVLYKPSPKQSVGVYKFTW